MSAHEITLTLPEELHALLASRARTSAQASDEVIAQALTRQFILAPEPHLPAAIQAELRAMSDLSDDALWVIARSGPNEDTLALYDLLTERHADGTLTSAGKHLLGQLRDELDAVTLRKAQAFALLRSRGVALPSLALEVQPASGLP